MHILRDCPWPLFIIYKTKAVKETDSEVDPESLMLQNATPVVIAGSDTTASVLSLRNETLGLRPQYGPILVVWHQPGTVVFIPKSTTAFVSPYAMHRDSRYLPPRPDGFWSERWLQSPPTKTPLVFDSTVPFILEKDTFIPFSIGAANCAGRPISLVEVKLVIPNIERRFNLASDDDFDPDQWEKELLDRFVIVKGQLGAALRVRGLRLVMVVLFSMAKKAR
ncbi:cytochrome P450 [Macrolepiota fuliginosa MF-IS2]|uniref:Cytochrome P450 n=1 Tax=Macrolepiota fuliginosa MF-IS2 TaxID=1400762 RepID=A0A9P6BX98_9AGAR|nr:cytochrome P450 [Macrolepiota fuliginosa MF-IS2]